MGTSSYVPKMTHTAPYFIKCVFILTAETAAILCELSSQENRKGSAIEVPIELSPEKEQVELFIFLVSHKT